MLIIAFMLPFAIVWPYFDDSMHYVMLDDDDVTICVPASSSVSNFALCGSVDWRVAQKLGDDRKDFLSPRQFPVIIALFMNSPL